MFVDSLVTQDRLNPLVAFDLLDTSGQIIGTVKEPLRPTAQYEVDFQGQKFWLKFDLGKDLKNFVKLQKNDHKEPFHVFDAKQQLIGSLSRRTDTSSRLGTLLSYIPLVNDVVGLAGYGPFDYYELTLGEQTCKIYEVFCGKAGAKLCLYQNDLQAVQVGQERQIGLIEFSNVAWGGRRGYRIISQDESSRQLSFLFTLYYAVTHGIANGLDAEIAWTTSKLAKQKYNPDWAKAVAAEGKAVKVVDNVERYLEEDEK